MIEDDIRTRAYHLWKDRTGSQWWDPISNWKEAERAVLAPRPRLLLYLAAGASLDLGISSTWALTTSVLARLANPSGFGDPSVAAAHQKAIHDAAQRTYGSPNFEHILHCLEALTGLIRSQDPNTTPSYRLIEAELCDGLHKSLPSPISGNWLIAAHWEFFQTIYDEVLQTTQAAPLQPRWPEFRDFLARLNREFDMHIVTTNYDTLVESALGWGAAEQGFTPVSGESILRFTGQASLPKLLHMHGSLAFGYRDIMSSDPNRFLYEDDHEDLHLHPNPASAVATWFGRSTQNSMAGRSTIAGPIITGLQKPDKLLPEPYSSYYRQFQELASSTPRVMVVGYGFGDQHVNAVMSRLTRWHGAQRRIVLVDHCKPDDWIPASGWPVARLPLYRTVAKLAEQNDALDQLAWPDPWAPTSINGSGRVEVYFRGFLDTVVTHGDRIVRFLKS